MLDRTEIRKAIINLLTDKIPSIDGGFIPVYSSRVVSWDIKELPGISVYTPSDRGISPAASQIPVFNFLTTVSIEIAVASGDGWDDYLDEVCENIENLILKNPEFIKKFTQITSYSTTLDYKAGGEFPVASAVMSFDFSYDLIFKPNYPDDLNEIRADIKIGSQTIKTQINFNQGEDNVQD